MKYDDLERVAEYRGSRETLKEMLSQVEYSDTVSYTLCVKGEHYPIDGEDMQRYLKREKARLEKSMRMAGVEFHQDDTLEDPEPIAKAEKDTEETDSYKIHEPYPGDVTVVEESKDLPF